MVSSKSVSEDAQAAKTAIATRTLKECILRAKNTLHVYYTTLLCRVHEITLRDVLRGCQQKTTDSFATGYSP